MSALYFGRSEPDFLGDAQRILKNRLGVMRHWRHSRAFDALERISFLEKDLRQSLTALMEKAQRAGDMYAAGEIRTLLENAGYQPDTPKPVEPAVTTKAALTKKKPRTRLNSTSVRVPIT